MEHKTNIAQLNIYVSDRVLPHVNNGYYTLVFQEELDAIVRNEKVSGSTFRVLGFLIAHVDNKNFITVSSKELAGALHYSPPTIYRALDSLIKMQLICKAPGRGGNRYELTSKLLNPRLAYYGNSQKLIKAGAPIIMCPDGNTPLIPNQWSLEELSDNQEL